MNNPWEVLKPSFSLDLGLLIQSRLRGNETGKIAVPTKYMSTNFIMMAFVTVEYVTVDFVMMGCITVAFITVDCVTKESVVADYVTTCSSGTEMKA